MHDFVLKEIINADMAKEIESIGFDSTYVKKASDKFKYKNLKIYGLTVAQANILKQTALSVGADCATHRETITGKIERTDCILGGSFSHMKKIAKKLSAQPFGLKKLGFEILLFTTNSTYESVRKNELMKFALENIRDFSPQGLMQRIEQESQRKISIVGILNLTTNSFSDGGEFYDYDKAVEHFDQMLKDGADIIDIGAESTKPYSQAVSDEDQLAKLIPVLEYASNKNAVLSIDTRSAKVAEECLKLGAHIINDVSGFDYDSDMPAIVAKYNAKVIIQHSKGTPENMQDNPIYSNLIDEIYLGLKNKIDLAISKGIKRENIIIDPGIGFGKTREDNFEIINRIEEFYGLGCPVMLGISRKSLLNMSDSDNFTKDIYTTALNTLAITKKVDYIRVHNVKMHKALIEMFPKIC